MNKPPTIESIRSERDDAWKEIGRLREGHKELVNSVCEMQAQRDALQKQLTTSETHAKSLEDIIHAAPHEPDCQQLRNRASLEVLRTGHPCVCWKAVMLRPATAGPEVQP